MQNVYKMLWEDILRKNNQKRLTRCFKKKCLIIQRAGKNDKKESHHRDALKRSV